MSRKKNRAKDLKKQRWAVIVASVLALAMIVSLIGALGVGFGQQDVISDNLIGPGNDEPGEIQPEDYVKYYREEIELLERHLEDNEPSEEILLQLLENYRYLIIIKQVYFDQQDMVEELHQELVAIQKNLIELDSENPEYRLSLIEHYFNNHEDEQVIMREVVQLLEIIREKPDPLVHLILINMLQAMDDTEVYEEELFWLYSYLEEKIEQEIATNEEKFYYAVLIGEYMDDHVTAKQLLETILDNADEDSQVFEQAASYLEHIQSEDEKIVLD